MENIIKKVIEIENAAKDRLIEIKKSQQKHKDDCYNEFKQLKQLKYSNIDEKINLYKKEQKRIFDTNVDTIESNQKKINQKLINDFKSRYDSNLNDLFKRITT
jgi:hypothetical protein